MDEYIECNMCIIHLLVLIFQCVMLCVSVRVECAVVSVDGARHGKGSAGVCG